MLLILASSGDAASVQSSYWYPSSVSSDANGPLDLMAELNYDNSRTNAPIAVVMHGYSNGNGVANVRGPAQRLRDNGFFAISVALRGRDGSDGTRDSGGVEIHDIYDAVEAVKADPAFAGLIDTSNVHITGYSGGGGNTMAALTKFPDYFRLGASYFGMSDYGYDLTNGWYNNGADHRTAQLDIDVGNPNTGGSTVLDRYLARASNLASKNNPYSEIHLFVKHDETICPPWNSISYRDNAIAAASASGEFDNITLHIGGLGAYQDFNNNSINDANELQDWPHTVPNANRQDAAELWYRDRLLAGTIPEPVLNNSDELRVAGYVVTSKFRLWLGDGQDAAADLSYSLSSSLMRFSLVIVTSDQSKTGDLTIDTSAMAGRQVLVELDDVIIDSFNGGGSYLYQDLGHNETLELIDNGPAVSNDPPTLSAFAGAVDSTFEATEVEITFAELTAQGDEADTDGTVDTFLVQSVINGSLRLGTDAQSATAFALGSNDTIGGSRKAYWTPSVGLVGAGREAFTVVAQDNSLDVSSTAVAVPVDVVAAASPKVGLIAYYDFENDLLDSSGNENHGVNSGVSFSSDVDSSLTHSSQSGYFDGASYVDLGALGLFDQAQSSGLTVSFWVKTGLTSQNAWVLAGGNDTDTDTAYVWGTRTAANGKAHNYIRNDDLSVNETASSAANAFVVGEWHHVLFTDDAGLISLYIDGVLDSNSAALGYSPSGSFTFENTSIGAWIRGGALANYFTGHIDDFAIFDAVLAASQIADLAAGEDPMSLLNTYSNWIDLYFPGESDPAIVGLNADPDGDGVDNGVENFFGTRPDRHSRGIMMRNVSGTNFSFTHPMSDAIAEGLTAIYEWSTDLLAFYPDGDSNQSGTTTVTFSEPVPEGEVYSVTATITGSTIPERMFVLLSVSQN